MFQKTREKLAKVLNPYTHFSADFDSVTQLLGPISQRFLNMKKRTGAESPEIPRLFVCQSVSGHFMGFKIVFKRFHDNFLPLGIRMDPIVAQIGFQLPVRQERTA